MGGYANLCPVRRALTVVAAVLLVVVVIVGLSQAGGGSDGGSGKSSAAKGTAAKELAGAPAPLAKLHQQAGQLLDGGAAAYRGRLAELRGYPVVVNKWASWCGPCRAEFPFFEKVSREQGKKVAFLGVNSNDNDASAKDFASQFDLSYPSYRDPGSKVAQVFNGVAAFPVTVFYDARGKQRYMHQGGYTSEQRLRDDIKRYTS
jgi:cytochrome c biogenesis protein CcmG/thiol:disulfide interchange protein DsbE